jgi:hypothetical protein
MRPALLPVAAAAVLAVAACGSSRHAAAPPPAQSPRVKHDLARIHADLARLRTLTAPVTTSSLMGTPAIQNATGRFLDDLTTSKIPLIQQNRLIDFAAAAVTGVCGQCFQMLEAARPIPELAHPNA